jgi:NDP-sugar pyrophosphorylase family protein
MTMRIRHAVILAAGRGRRMMPLTQSIPKPLAPYQDTTLIGHGIAQVRRYIPNVHVTVGYKGAMVAAHLFEIGVTSVFNTDGQSNSWWLFNTLLRNLNEPLFVLTCDNVTDLELDLLEEDYFATGEPACMLVPVKPVPGLEGDYIFHENRVVTALSRTTPADVYCSGIQVIHPVRVNAIASHDGDFYRVWADLMAQKQLVMSSVCPKKWFSVDTMKDLQDLSAEMPESK